MNCSSELGRNYLATVHYDRNRGKVVWAEVKDNDIQQAIAHFMSLPELATPVVGFGDGKSLDVANNVAFLVKSVYFAVPTSLSNDRLTSTQARLTIVGTRRSLVAAMPFGVVGDTTGCEKALRRLTLYGVGEHNGYISSHPEGRKLTARNVGVPIDVFATSFSDGSVHVFLARPVLDEREFTTGHVHCRLMVLPAGGHDGQRPQLVVWCAGHAGGAD